MHSPIPASVILLALAVFTSAIPTASLTGLNARELPAAPVVAPLLNRRFPEDASVPLYPRRHGGRKGGANGAAAPTGVATAVGAAKPTGAAAKPAGSAGGGAGAAAGGANAAGTSVGGAAGTGGAAAGGANASGVNAGGAAATVAGQPAAGGG